MQFSTLVGQQAIKNKLIQTVANGRISHTQLFLGAEGVGALPMAVAYAQFVNCIQPSDKDSCGICSSCIKFNTLTHPDLHFTFPTIRVEKDKKKLSNDFIAEWREAFVTNPYLGEHDWLLKLDNEGKKQGNITADECRDIIRKLSLKPYEAKYKTVIIWLPEYLKLEGNILLKLFEEPPPQTLILLVAQDADKVIATILSRAQTVCIPRLTAEDITSYLVKTFNTEADIAENISHISEGSIVQAESLLNAGYAQYFDLFTSWMRLCFNARKELLNINVWIDKTAVEGREFLKSYFNYCQHMLRAALVHKFGAPHLLKLNTSETVFIQKFSAAITQENIPILVAHINQCSLNIERNADIKITLLNLSLHIGKLLNKQK